MKIAHVLRRISFDDWGGTEQVVWNLAKAQKAAGHDVRLFATTALWKPADGGRCVGDSASCHASPNHAAPHGGETCPHAAGFAETVDGIEILRLAVNDRTRHTLFGDELVDAV